MAHLFIQKYMNKSLILNIQIADTYLYYPHANLFLMSLRNTSFFILVTMNSIFNSQISKPLTKTKMSIISFKSNVKGNESLPQTLVFESQYHNNPIQLETLDISNYDFCYNKSKFEISQVYIIRL